MTVMEISECFPNNFKPVTGEFIFQHVKALSGKCSVIAVVPLRFIPAKELMTLNPFRLISNFSKWFSILINTESFSEGNLKVIYFSYVSLPHPFFEFIDKSIINFFFYKKIKRIADKYRPDVIYCNWIRPWADISAEVAANLGVPFVLDHHEDIPTLKKIFPGSYKKFLGIFEKADKIIVHSSINKEELTGENLKLPGVEIIHLGQNFSITGTKKIFKQDKLKLICISHLNEERKNIDDLITAVSNIKDKMNFELTIAGDGMLKEKYIRQSKGLNLENEIKFLGSQSREEIGDLLNLSDIFILPSYPEAFGIVFIEALAKGVPVITCKGNGGGEELRKSGYPVVLVSPHSPAELSNAILDLSRDKNKMLLMSDTGKEIVRKFFTWDINAENTYNTIKDTLNEFNNRKPCAE